MRQSLRFSISIGIFLLFFVHISGLFKIGLLLEFESYLYDTRIRMTMLNTKDSRVAIVDLDEQSLQEIGQWPWPRDTLGNLVNILFDEYFVSIVGFDALFAEPDESSALRLLTEMCDRRAGDPAFIEQECGNRINAFMTDQIFSESLIARDVVLGIVFDDQVRDGVAREIGQLPQPLLKAEQLVGSQIPFVTAAGYVAPLPILQREALTAGFFDNPLIDADGIVRRVPLMQLYKGDLYESLALAMTRIALGNPSPKFVFETDDPDRRTGIDLEAVRLGDRLVHVDQNVAVRVPYRGLQGSFPYISAIDILNRKADHSMLEDTIVLVGTSAIGLVDVRATPVGKIYNGVEVHANIISGILDGRIKQQPDYTRAIELITILVVGFILAAYVARLTPIIGFSLIGLMGAVVIGSNLYLWQQHNLVVPLASSLLYLLITAFLHMNYGFFIESRNKRRLSGIFSQYIPPELVDEMDQTESDINLEGESREMSVLFSDVRGFTTISEGLEPGELTQFMNDFLTPITEVIHNHRGTIDKYMGDAVMAFWGAPLKDPDHARNALKAAMAIDRKMHTLAQEFRANGRPEIRVGIGINSGLMNVGNMGSKFRMAYTVLGDAVNLGARIEGQTKNYGVDIIVSEYTALAVPEYLYRELDRVRVKGKNQPVAIFEPIGLSEKLPMEIKLEIARHQLALMLFHAQHWDLAEAELQALHKMHPRKIYSIYMERTQHFRENPPGELWDGVYTQKTK